MTSEVEDALSTVSKDAVIDAGLLTFGAPLETVIGTNVTAKLLNMAASELAVAVATIRRRSRR